MKKHLFSISFPSSSTFGQEEKKLFRSEGQSKLEQDKWGSLQHSNILSSQELYTCKRPESTTICVPGMQSTTAADTMRRSWRKRADGMRTQSASWSGALVNILGREGVVPTAQEEWQLGAVSVDGKLMMFCVPEVIAYADCTSQALCRVEGSWKLGCERDFVSLRTIRKLEFMCIAGRRYLTWVLSFIIFWSAYCSRRRKSMFWSSMFLMSGYHQLSSANHKFALPVATLPLML